MAKSFDELVRRTTSKKTQSRAALRTRELLADMVLRELRQLTGESEQQVAAALGIKQPSLSKLEQQFDMQISTLRKIVQSLGGELEVRAKLPQATVKIAQFAPPRRPSRQCAVRQVQQR